MKASVLFLTVLVMVCVLLLQPLTLIGENYTRMTLHVGKTVEVVAIAEAAGGYRCYINDSEYFWVSSSECIQKPGDQLCVKFSIAKPTIIYRGEA